MTTKREYVVVDSFTGHAVTKFYRQRAAAEWRANELDKRFPSFKHVVREFAGHIVTKGK